MKLPSLLFPVVLLAPAYAAVAIRGDDTQIRTLESKRRGDDNYGHAYELANGDDKTFDITLFHVNDIHAHLDIYRSSGANCTDLTKGCYGGYPSIKATVDYLRPQKKNSLFLNIGDEFQVRLHWPVPLDVGC